MPTNREIAQTLIDSGLHREHSEAAYVALLNGPLLGTLWRHYRNRHVYCLNDFMWCGDLDEWCVRYMREGSIIPYVRSMSNAFGFIDGVNRRFEEVFHEL